MNGVATKVSQEICVLLQDNGAHSGAAEQVA
jgi:hypothetical protein